VGRPRKKTVLCVRVNVGECVSVAAEIWPEFDGLEGPSPSSSATNSVGDAFRVDEG